MTTQSDSATIIPIPKRRPTELEREQRIERVVDLLGAGRRKSEIKTELETAYGIDVRQAERYLSLARQRIVARTGRSKDEHRVDSFAFYESVCSDQNLPARDRLLARIRLDALLGLDPPGRQIHAVSAGSAVTVIEVVPPGEASGKAAGAEKGA